MALINSPIVLVSLQGDYQFVGTKAEIAGNFGIIVETPGWYVHRACDDHMLALHVRNDTWKVCVWNGRDPRPELAALLALPTTEV